MLRTPFYYGWLIVAVVVLSNFAQVGLFNPVLSVFMKPMADEFGWSRTQISLGITLGSIGAGIVSPFLGPYLDRYGTRLALGVGQFLYGGVMLLLGLVGSLWQFYLVFSGSRILAFGVTNLAGAVLVGNWFVRKRSRAMAFSILGIRGGQALLPILAQVLILTWGWRVAWVGLGLLVWAVAVVPSLLLVRRRPEDVGLLPDGDGPEDLPKAAGHSPAEPGSSRPNPEYHWTLAQARRTPALWLLTVAASCFSLGIGAVNLHLVSYLTDAGLSPQAAVGALTTLAVAGGVGGVFWGIVAERWSMRGALVLAFLIEALATLMLLRAPDIPWAYTFTVIYGVNFGGLQTLTTVVFTDYFGRQSAGAINGFAAPPQMIGNAAGPVLSGLVFDFTGSYGPAFVTIAASYLLGGAVMTLAARPVPPTPRPLPRG